MNYLVDTNVLLRVRDADDPRYHECVAAVDQLKDRGEGLFVCSQVLAEFWVVLTRPCNVNGCGLAFDDAMTAVCKVRATFLCVSEPTDMADRWLQVVSEHKPMGKQAHDARLAALRARPRCYSPAHPQPWRLRPLPADHAGYAPRSAAAVWESKVNPVFSALTL